MTTADSNLCILTAQINGRTKTQKDASFLHFTQREVTTNQEQISEVSFKELKVWPTHEKYVAA